MDKFENFKNSGKGVYLALHFISGGKYDSSEHQKLIGPFPDSDSALEYAKNLRDRNWNYDLIDLSKSVSPDKFDVNHFINL